MKLRLAIIALLCCVVCVVKAQSSGQSLEIDASSFRPVQTDALSGVAIDPIGLDRSKRPCARIKMHVNRMTRDEIENLVVQPIGGNVVLMKRIVAAEGTGLIFEMTAKQPTRFYLHHDTMSVTVISPVPSVEPVGVVGVSASCALQAHRERSITNARIQDRSFFMAAIPFVLFLPALYKNPPVGGSPPGG